MLRYTLIIGVLLLGLIIRIPYADADSTPNPQATRTPRRSAHTKAKPGRAVLQPNALRIVPDVSLMAPLPTEPVAGSWQEGRRQQQARLRRWQAQVRQQEWEAQAPQSTTPIPAGVRHSVVELAGGSPTANAPLVAIPGSSQRDVNRQESAREENLRQAQREEAQREENAREAVREQSQRESVRQESNRQERSREESQRESRRQEELRLERAREESQRESRRQEQQREEYSREQRRQEERRQENARDQQRQEERRQEARREEQRRLDRH